jgi:uncharacterized protein with HEPN domain
MTIDVAEAIAEYTEQLHRDRWQRRAAMVWAVVTTIIDDIGARLERYAQNI